MTVKSIARGLKKALSRRRLYLALLADFHTAKPVTKHQNHDTSKGGKTEIQRSKGKEHPTAPEPNEMACYKAKNAQAKI